jgi:phosphodiesterase/alkaline phosphatase D-like protein
MVCKAQMVTHGPITGAVTPNSARFYIRTTQASAVKMELSTDTFFTNVVTVIDSTKDWRDSSNLFYAAGLNAFTTYHYRVFVNGVLDTIRGSFKTFPAVGAKGRYKWGVLSCQEFGTYNAFNALYDQMPQLVLHTGDFTYPDYQIPGDHRMDWSLQQLSYRKRYREQNMQKDFLSMAFDYVPDNHDGAGQRDNITGVNSYIDSLGAVHNEIYVEPVPAGAVENVFKGYYEYFPHYPPADSMIGMYHNYRYGNCEVFFLDTRHCGNGEDSTFTFDVATQQWIFDPKPGQSLLGDAQFNWLLNGLKNSTADWKFIVSQLMFNRQFRKVIQISLALQNITFSLGGTTGTGFRLAHAIANNWCAYPREQDSLLHFLKTENINDVIVVSGHVHTNVMDNGSNAGLPELNTGPAAGSGAELTFYIDSVMQLLQQGTAIDSLWNGGGQGVENKNFKSGFGTVEIFESDSVVMKTVDEDNFNVSSMTILHSSIAPSSINNLQTKSCVIENIYPNVSNNLVYVKFCADYQSKPTDRSYLIDLNGRVVTKSVSRNVFSVKELAAGNYLYVYDFGAEVKTFPLSVVK